MVTVTRLFYIYIVRWLQQLVAAEAKSSKAHAGVVVGRPARWAFLAGSVLGLFTVLAETKFSEAFAGVVISGVDSLARPASAFGAFALSVFATRADGGALRGRGKHLGWVAETNGSKAHTGLVFLGPAIRALLAGGVLGRLAFLAETELGEAFASLVGGCVKVASWPA